MVCVYIPDTKYRVTLSAGEALGKLYCAKYFDETCKGESDLIYIDVLIKTIVTLMLL